MPLAARTLWAGILLAASLGAQSPPAADPTDAARPLTAQGLDNLRALARMFGFVRYFYPSDEAASADWNRFAVAAIPVIEPASSPADLASRLQTLFAPFAPQVRVMAAGAPRPLMEMQSGPYVLLYQYRGLGPPQGRTGAGFYSTRFLVPATQAPVVAFAPLREDLPGAVTCMVPLAQYRPQGQGQPPQPSALPPPGGSPADRAVRLAAVIVAWNAFQHFYPYFEELGPVWLGALGPLLSEAAQDKDASSFYATLQKMLQRLRDGQATLNGPGAPPDAVPPVVWTVAEGRIVALSVQGPADVKPGDTLVSIDGRPASDVLAALQATAAGSTPQLLRERVLPYLLARAPGTKISVELEAADPPAARRSVSLECTARAAALRPPRPEKFAQPDPGVFYFDMSRLTDADLNAAVPTVAQAHGMIFDFRSGLAPTVQLFPLLGRLLNRPVQGPPMAVPIVSRPDGADSIYQENQWVASPMPPSLPGKKVFLIGGLTTGGAETVAAVVERGRVGDLIGDATGGASGMLNTFSLPGGYDITWTGERVRQYDGSPLFGAGIRPTIPIAPTRSAIAAGRDEVLDRAIQSLK